MLIRARLILPLAGPPLENGAILIRGSRIAAVGRWTELQEYSSVGTLDLGETVIFPGLINAHCHLDYTDMVGSIAPPKFFPDWVKALLALKAHWSYTDYASSWVRGAWMLLRHGVTTVADIEAVPELLPEVRTATPLRLYSFLEMTGVKARRPPIEVLNDAIATIDSLPLSDHFRAGLSPHAPYSTTPELLSLSAVAARRRNWRVTMHLSESEPEFDMFVSRSGPLFQWLSTQRDMNDCGLGSPTRHLAQHDLLGSNLLAVHVNYLASGDAELLGSRGVHVVHCPRSHAYFNYRPFPLDELQRAHVNVCLGTDSLASVHKESRMHTPELNPFLEMALFAGRHDISRRAILEMFTGSAARALGLEGEIGEISSGALADLVGIPFSGAAAEVFDCIVHHPGEISCSMIGGVWAVPPT